MKTAVFDGLTLNTGADLTTVNNANVTIRNGLVLNGVMPVGKADGSTYGQVYFGDRSSGAGGEPGGTGSIVFGSSASNTLNNDSAGVGGPGTLTIGGGVLVHGHRRDREQRLRDGARSSTAGRSRRT